MLTTCIVSLCLIVCAVVGFIGFAVGFDAGERNQFQLTNLPKELRGEDK